MLLLKIKAGSAGKSEEPRPARANRQERPSANFRSDRAMPIGGGFYQNALPSRKEYSSFGLNSSRCSAEFFPRHVAPTLSSFYILKRAVRSPALE